MEKVYGNDIIMQNEINTTLCMIMIDKVLLGNLNPSDLKIATMTIGVTTHRQLPSLDLFDDNFVERLKLDNRFIFESLTGYGTTKTKWTNSRILRLSYNNYKKYIIIFKNGSFQIAGCKEVTDATTIVHAIIQHARLDPLNSATIQCDIRMINSTFSLGRSIDLVGLHKIAVSQFSQAFFNADSGSSGVNIPMMIDKKKVAVIVYSKGSVVMTGANAIAQLERCYNHLTMMIDTHFDALTKPLIEVVKVPKKRGRKRKADTEDFYNALHLDI